MIPTPNKGQAIFLWLVGIISLIAAVLLAGRPSYADAGSPLPAVLIGIVSILVALGYRKPTP